jgi:aryl-alcohol dehydrogenase-like predicted oxidoreductase
LFGHNNPHPFSAVNVSHGAAVFNAALWIGEPRNPVELARSWAYHYNMNYRRLGKTGLQVSEIGFGAWGIGRKMWVGANDNQSLRALNESVDRGVNLIDTALVYGKGHSERLIGQVVKARSERLYVATKVPPKNFRWPAQGEADEAFPGDHIASSTEKSLQNLRVDCLDLLQLHVWSPDWLHSGSWLEQISELKRQGKIAFFGVSINDHAPATALDLVRSGLIDTVQVIYNIFDQSPEDDLLPLCLEHGTGVIARVPFDEGALTGAISPEKTFPKKDWRNWYFKDNRKIQVNEHVDKLKDLVGEQISSLPELALRFCLNHPAVCAVIPGMRTVEHVHSNVSVSGKPPLPKELAMELKKHRWEKNFYH